LNDMPQTIERLRSLIDHFAVALLERLPGLVGALLLLLAGWIVAGWLRKLTRTLGTRLNRQLSRVLRGEHTGRVRLSPALLRLLSNLVFWVVIFGFITAASRLAQLAVLTDWLSRIVDWLPQLLLGVLIIVTGYLISAIVRDLAYDALDSAGIEQRALIGKLAQAATFLAALVIGIDQVGIDVTFVTTMIAVVLGVVLAGFSLAFGLGARRLVANLVAAGSLQGQFAVGQRARIGGIEGEITEFTPTGVFIASAEGRIHVPASRFNDELVELLGPASGHGCTP
jgi:Mechanosensitive ion channel, conserved TM helix